MADYKDLHQAVIEGNYKAAESLVKQALDKGDPAPEISSRGLIPAMEVVGQKMKSGEYYIPEVLMSVKAFKTASAILKPLLARTSAGKPLGKVVLGTAQGDLHDIGKNLVGMMLEGGGFEVIDLGIDIPAAKFVQAVKETNASLIGISALLTTTMVNMRDVIEILKKTGQRQKVKVMIGGAPVSQRFCDEIGADGTSKDAVGAVELAKKLIGTSR